MCFLVFNLSRVKLQEEATIVALENVQPSDVAFPSLYFNETHECS